MFGQELDAYDLGITPNNYLGKKNTVDYCLMRQDFSLRHLYILGDTDYRLFLKHADKFKHIDSLSIGREGSLCKLVYELENKVLERMPDLPSLPNLRFLSVMIISMKYPVANLGDFKQLRFLELVGDYEQIPASIWDLQHLEVLHLSAYFKEVSQRVYSLPKLRVLTLEGKYQTLPSFSGNTSWKAWRI